ncbi:MAG: hypothetical protein ACKOB4_05670 [Acidobacteriota bacterium]
MSISTTGEFLIESISQLQRFVELSIGVTIAVILGLLLLRYLPELFKLNPFGSTYQMMRRPTNELIQHMRLSRFHQPLRRSFGFDPSLLMVLIALAILWYVVNGVLQNFFFILRGLGWSLLQFGAGSIFTGTRYLIGSLLLAALFFLMALMSIVFVNWIFGLLRRQAWWALDRLNPLLRLFEFGGAFAGWSFMILWIAISFASLAVQAVFF